MDRTIGRLNARKVASLQKARPVGMHCDGGGLYVQIEATGNCSWIYRYGFRGKSRWMGFGSLKDVSLAEARAKAAECRKQKANGLDPLEVQRRQRAQEVMDATKAITFQRCAELYIQAKRPGWKNTKHAQQWENTLKMYVEPVFGHLPVQDIDTSLVVKVLTPIWATKNETAGRVRGRMEAIFDWAKSCGYREGENPARWRGHLKHQLAAPGKLRKNGHHAALPHRSIGSFMADLRAVPGAGARALELTILTASRTQEVLGARWEEFDMPRRIWTIPGRRMKAGRDHKVPLSDAVIQLLEGEANGSEYVFPGKRMTRPLSGMAMAMVLRRVKRGVTVHGFRSTFRDWAAEFTQHPREVAEAALAHVSGNKTEAAYLRTDFFMKRRQLMTQWAAYCDQANDSPMVLQFSDAVTA